MSTLSPFSLKGKSALVTGGAAGIGQAIAIGLAQAGARVAVTQHRTPATQTLEQLGAGGVALDCDVSDLTPERASALITRAEADLGPLDILINNAGIIRRGDAAHHSAQDWRDVQATNLDAVWYLSQAAGQSMLAHGGGRIVNIASLLSFQGGIRVPGYAAAKHGVAGLTKALANEWAGQGIGVNAIAPGYIATDNTRALRDDPDRSRQILERIPAGRWGRAEDIAGAAVFLCTPAAAYVHGEVLTVDGGWMAR